MRRTHLPTMMLSVVACATVPSARARQIREADEKGVASCDFVATYTGTSGWSGLAASTGINNARNEVLGDAASAGATHIVWVADNAGWGSTATGRAYRCHGGK